MNGIKQFFLENLSISVLLHLTLVTVMITSLFVIVEKSKLIAPDRIEITEIDLSMVKITAEDTSLYNTTPPPVPVDNSGIIEEPSAKNVKNTQPEDGDDAPLDGPTMIEAKPVPVPAPAPKTPDTNAVVRKNIVRVNRETLSLDRTMTVSVVDALRIALTRCWVIDSSRKDISDIRAVAHLTMYKNGIVGDVWFESAARADSDPAFAYVLETIRNALNACSPFKMLPASEFEHWEKIQLTFYPSDGKIM